MRLIDADELRKEINKQAYPHSDSTANDIYFSVLHLLTDAPTVDGVRHGKWLRNDDSWWCSECETENCFAYSEELKRFTDLYCPHCGARMEGCSDA
jgi:DNA-directed RNA polymerase subunit RPC12/RpoP